MHTCHSEGRLSAVLLQAVAFASPDVCVLVEQDWNGVAAALRILHAGR